VTERFDPTSVAGLDEPVRRYLTHAIREGAPLARPIQMKMNGRIRLRRWRRFTAQENGDGRSYRWDARLHAGPVTVLEVVDNFGAGHADTYGMLFGLIQLFHAGDENTTRSAAARAALETVWCPTSLLPEQRVNWRAESDEQIVAAFEVPPESVELTLEIGEAGELKSVVLPRWSNAGGKDWGYVPCGATSHAERDFGPLVVPGEVTFEWWFGTPQPRPYFMARMDELSVG
jgi:hypothetical protein